MSVLAVTADPCTADRCRPVLVAFIGELQVPRHITRVETQRTAGWQVRFTSPSKFFSDSTAGGAEAALDLAKQYLRSIYRPERKTTWRGRSRRSRQQAGIKVECTQAHGAVSGVVEAFHPARGSSKRFRVHGGTQERDAAINQAIDQRAAWLSELEHPLR